MSDPIAASEWVVSIDAGGTFTDAVARGNNGAMLLAKVDSTPDDPSQGLMNALASLEEQGVSLEDVDLLCHGTTVATNAMLTGRTANVALVTTDGFRDVMGYRQSIRPSLYSLTPTRPLEVVSRRNTLTLKERITADGSVLTPLTDAEIDRVIDELRDIAPDAIAVSFLFSYLNDSHETSLGARLHEAFPELPITLSSQVAREFREYPRTATAVINAALRPVVAGYLERAEAGIASRKIDAPVVVMQSNGGCVMIDRAAENAHKLMMSGPAGGVAGLASLARDHGLRNVISFDMGGTSLDVCLVKDNEAPYVPLQVVQDHTLLAPTIDIHSIGAGGGSIAWIDSSKRLRVGPQSAGASPGPAAYGRGGVEPTITDAHVVLGTLGSGVLASGLALDRQSARNAVERLSEPLGMETEDVADTIIAVSLAQMIRAVRKVSIERGLDPRDFVLVPFGGAGPLHAGLVVRHMGLKGAIVPVQPGLFAADGLLAAGLRVDDAQTLLRAYTPGLTDEVSAWFADRQEALRNQLLSDSVLAETIEVSPSLDCRYQGQGYEIPVPLDSVTPEGVAKGVQTFHHMHETLYGHADAAAVVEIVTLRIAANGLVTRVKASAVETDHRGAADQALLGEKTVRFPGTDKAVAVPLFDRRLLHSGDRIEGPAIILQMDTTTLVLDGQYAEVLDTGDIWMGEK